MDGFFDYFQANPNMGGLFIAAVGVLLFIGTVLKWKWVLSPGRRRSFLRAIFGPRGEMFIISAVLILGGIALFIVL